MAQVLANTSISRTQAEVPEWFEEIMVGSFCAVGRRNGSAVVVNLANRIASANEADEMDELSGFDLLISKLKHLNPSYFIFDISRVTEIDFTALQHFLGAKSVLENGGGRVVLTGLPSNNDALLSDLLTLFPHFSNPEDAIHYLESGEYACRNSEPASHSPEAGTGPDKKSSDAEVSNGTGIAVQDCPSSRQVIEDKIFNYYSLAD